MESLSIPSDSPEQATAKNWLKSILNKTLRVHATDGRLFVGVFKCTDPEGNIVLSFCHEYRQPSPKQLAEAAAAAQRSNKPTVSADMTSRYLGLVVVPGKFVTKIEVEEFVSQLPNRSAHAT